MNKKVKNQLLFQTLKTLSTKDWLGFLDFVRQPTFNKNERVLRFLNFLDQSYPNFNTNEQAIWQAIEGDKPLDQQQLKDVRSLLFRLLKNYLAIKQLMQSETAMDLSILTELRERGLSKGYKNHFQNLKKRINNQPSDLLFSYQLEKESALFNDQLELRQTGDNLQTLVDRLDAFYAFEKLKWTCEMLNRSRIINKSYNFTLFEELLNTLNAAHLQLPIIQSYHQVYKTLKEPDEEQHFVLLKDMLTKFNNDFPKEEATSLYRYAQNYCIGKINKGESHYMRELFDIYRQLLDSNLMLENGQLAHPHYKNIVTVGLRLGENKWTLDFIENYRSYIESQIRDNAYHFNLATWYYETHDYDQVVDLLNRVEFTDVYYQISSRYILLKVYYDLDELGPLQYLIISFDRYIRRNKDISTQNRQGILHFLQALKRMIKIKEWKSHKSTDFIDNQKEKTHLLLTTKKPMVNLPWLMQKWKEL